MASILIGICAGYMINAYIDSPETFALKDHFGLISVIIGMILFIVGHLRFRKSVP